LLLALNKVDRLSLVTPEQPASVAGKLHNLKITTNDVLRDVTAFLRPQIFFVWSTCL
jgi:hypothetical protein